MLVNPGIQEWLDKLQGHPVRGGSAPRGTPQNYAAEALQGIVQPGRGMFGFNAPAIGAGGEPPRPAPSPGERGPMGIPPVAPSSSGFGARDLGGGAIAAGLGKLGAGIQQGLVGWAEKRKAQVEAQAVRDTAAASASRGFLSPKAPRPATASEPVAPPTPTFPPVGPASETPLLTQPGGGAGATGASISPADTSLPTLAQGAPSTAAPLPTSGIAALRYNNPGNISLPMAGWHGGGEIVGLKDQPQYARFPDMKTGMNAFQHRVADYIDSKGLNTISALNSKYATDKNWGAGVARAAGLDINAPLDTSNAGQMAALQRGILTQEMGRENAAKVLAAGGAPQVTSPSASAYAAAPPTSTEPGTALAAPAPAPLPPPRPADQPPLINGGQPGVYSAPEIGPQGMNDQVDPLAAALAGGAGDAGQAAPIDQSALLALALAQSQPNFSAPDFGGFFG